MIYYFSEEVFGDFEDLETGEKGTEEMDYDGKNFNFFIFYFVYYNYLDEDAEETQLQDKKAKLKSAFDAEYDQSKEGDSTYLDELKKEVEIQTKV